MRVATGDCVLVPPTPGPCEGEGELEVIAGTVLFATLPVDGCILAGDEMGGRVLVTFPALNPGVFVGALVGVDGTIEECGACVGSRHFGSGILASTTLQMDLRNAN
jgi:hypothetical protein